MIFFSSKEKQRSWTWDFSWLASLTFLMFLTANLFSQALELLLSLKSITSFPELEIRLRPRYSTVNKIDLQFHACVLKIWFIFFPQVFAVSYCYVSVCITPMFQVIYVHLFIKEIHIHSRTVILVNSFFHDYLNCKWG